MSLEELIAEARSLASKATAGPWVWDEDSLQMNVAGRRADPIIETDNGVYGPNEADRAFIAWARLGVPALVEALEVLSDKLKAAEEHHGLLALENLRLAARARMIQDIPRTMDTVKPTKRDE